MVLDGWGCGLVALDWIFTPENFWGPWAAHCSRRKPLKGIYLSQFQNMHMPTYQIEMLKMFWNHDATFSMPTSVTALEKEMSRRARWGQESEISLSRESVVTFKIDSHYSDWVVKVPYKKYRGLCPIMEGTKQYEIGNKKLKLKLKLKFLILSGRYF